MRSRPGSANRLRPVAMVTALVLLAAACSAASRARPVATAPATVSSVPPATSPAAPSTTAPRPAVVPPPPLRWNGCGNLECATMDVPLDDARPGSSTIGIALARHRAAVVPPLGTLVFLPGGPGDSGVDALPREVSAVPARVREQFDIVGIDPRGVGRSDPVRCSAGAGASAGPPAQLPDPVPMTSAARAALFAADRAYARACTSVSGALLANVGTAAAARDLERLRLALDAPQLSFVGQSYGTFLGLAYANAYPTHVRAMVLDGVVDPGRPLRELSAEQAAAFDRQFARFAAWCRSTGCAWRAAAGNATHSLLQLVARLRAQPLAAGGDRRLGPAEVYLGTIDLLYSESGWSRLASALAAAEAGAGAPLRDLSDDYLVHGSKNFGDANTAYNCLDHPAPVSLAAVEAQARAAARAAPIFGPFFAWGSLVCTEWPVRATTHPHVVRAAGSGTVLVVGATGDPATPYAWARTVARNLQHAALLTVRADAHVVAFAGGCAREVVDRYLVDLEVPPTGATCS